MSLSHSSQSMLCTPSLSYDKRVPRTAVLCFDQMRAGQACHDCCALLSVPRSWVSFCETFGGFGRDFATLYLRNFVLLLFSQVKSTGVLLHDTAVWETRFPTSLFRTFSHVFRGLCRAVFVLRKYATRLQYYSSPHSLLVLSQASTF